MKFLLKLKHWQLFGLSLGLPILFNFFAFSNPSLFRLFPIILIPFFIGTYGWIWAISTNLHYKLPEGVVFSKRKFQILFSIPVIYISLIIVFLIVYFNVDIEFRNVNSLLIPLIVVPLHLISLIIAIWGISFAAKTIKSIELGRMAIFSDYVGEFFLIWFSIIGYWILQPRINELIKE